MELPFSGSKISFPLNQFWKRCSWGFSRTRIKASAQSLCFMFQLGEVRHAGQIKVHQSVVWSSTWLCILWAQSSASPCQKRARNLVPKRGRREEGELSLFESFTYSGFSCLKWPCPSRPLIFPSDKTGRQVSTFPRHSDLAGHAFKLSLCSPYHHPSVGNRLGRC